MEKKGSEVKAGVERSKMEEIRNKKCLTVLCKGIYSDCMVTSSESSLL